MKKIVALVLAMVMVLGLATTAFAAKLGAETLGTAKADAGWDYVVTQDDPADAEDQTFATYEIVAVAKKDLGDVLPSWAAATLTDVEKGDKEDVEYNGAKAYVKVASEDYADLVLVDGKVITYYADAADYEDGYEGSAVKVTLPGYPADPADRKCVTLYNGTSPTPGTYYFYDDELYVSAAAGDVVLNVGGVAVKANVVDMDTLYTPHKWVINWANRDNLTVNASVYPTKVYCENCKAEAKFVYGAEEDALEFFGAGKYDDTAIWTNGVVSIWVELITPAVPGVSAATDAPAGDNTVESPKTFDAGIAMYVGMSVMAAAGSAVVLKKKD